MSDLQLIYGRKRCYLDGVIDAAAIVGEADDAVVHRRISPDTGREPVDVVGTVFAAPFYAHHRCHPLRGRCWASEEWSQGNVQLQMHKCGTGA